MTSTTTEPGLSCDTASEDNDSSAPAPSDHPTPQERLEAGRWGRAVISAFVIFTLAGTLVWNLPGSYLRDRLVPVFRPYFNAVGLDQGWDVFAPDPRDNTSELSARLDYADGTELTWHIPKGNPVFSSYRTFRWQKWTEFVTLTDEHELWEPAARWLAASHRRNGELPVQVTLTRDWYGTTQPGTPIRPPAWHHDQLYVLRFDGAPKPTDVGL